MPLSDFKLLSFDTYGTLIDWETGIYDALSPLLARAGSPPGRDEVLETFGRAESFHEKQTPAMVYSELLQQVYRTVANEWACAAGDEEASEFGRSVKHWPAFQDASGALKYLKRHYKVVTLTNCDRLSYRGSNARLDIEWDAIYTAQDVGSYKPDRRNFDYLLAHVQSDFGVEKPEILHVAQSLTHDHVPATEFGISKVWIDRRHDKGGFGATVPPQDDYRLEYRFNSMAAFAKAHEREMAQ